MPNASAAPSGFLVHAPHAVRHPLPAVLFCNIHAGTPRATPRDPAFQPCARAVCGRRGRGQWGGVWRRSFGSRRGGGGHWSLSDVFHANEPRDAGHPLSLPNAIILTPNLPFSLNFVLLTFPFCRRVRGRAEFCRRIYARDASQCLPFRSVCASLASCGV
jgi:hypothetical protein